MKSISIGKKILAALCLAILSTSIALFATTHWQFFGCATYCATRYKKAPLFRACMGGCLAKYNR